MYVGFVSHDFRFIFILHKQIETSETLLDFAEILTWPMFGPLG